ncbi:MAG: hypothetical protein OXH53_00875 [bacterium]|nr:hypothetical protein [bacterium]
MAVGVVEGGHLDFLEALLASRYITKFPGSPIDLPEDFEDRRHQ